MPPKLNTPTESPASDASPAEATGARAYPATSSTLGATAGATSAAAHATASKGPQSAAASEALGAAPQTVVLGSADDLRQRIRKKSQLKGRQADDAALQEVRTLLGLEPMRDDAGPYRRDLLIENLHQLNDAHHGLYERHLVALAQIMRVPMAEVYEVASFYHHFEVLHDGQPASAITLRVCDGLSCAMAGANELLLRLTSLLGSDSGPGPNPSSSASPSPSATENSASGVRIIRAPCVGRCEQAPVAVVQQNPVPYATPEAVLAQLQAKHTQHPVAQDYGNFQPALCVERAVTGVGPDGIAPAIAAGHAAEDSAPPYVGLSAYRAAGGYTLLVALERGDCDADAVIRSLEDSGLRGLGGAGFPAGRKWRIVREQAAPKLMAVNIDEGEPGTFKDRTYLERDPHRFLEGLLIAAKVVGIDACYLYLRDEYHGCRAILQAELARLQAEPPCALPRLELRRGAGAYICGEESAMIESIEGKRGEPRMRPPYIAQVGLFGRPTLEHNFETLYWVRDILEKGAAWFSSFGRNGRKGLRSFSVSGRVRWPGVKLAPAGISLQALVDEYCGGMADGHVLYAYLPGGASGGIFPARLAQLPLDFDTLQAHGGFIGSAAVIVLSQHDRARDAALNMMQFFADESCGQCTPCRVGTAKAARLLEAPEWDVATLEDLNQVMADASICGLGQAAPNPVRCVVQYFAHEVSAAGVAA